jgi:hypothetical protein
MSNQIDIVRELVSIANGLDSSGLHTLADQADSILKQAIPLSETELGQLGEPNPTSQFDYIDQDNWEKLRGKLVSKKPSRSYIETDEFKYDPELTAYTPGETLALLENPKIQEWFEKIEDFVIPEEYKHIILVPCAASKPWGVSCPSSGKYYKAYHDIKTQLNEEGTLAYWVTISEPLGVVPEDMWDNFPGYDVPGLFKDPSSRMSGMTTKQWKDMFGEKFSPPFDKEAYKEAVRKLGRVISKFIINNNEPGRRWISFVKGTKGTVTTHTDMIIEAKEFLRDSNIEWDHTEYMKEKGEAGRPTRSRIHEHISDILSGELDTNSSDEPNG